jgi:pimeloyl-ACP methyl ester carboxylesterase
MRTLSNSGQHQMQRMPLNSLRIRFTLAAVSLALVLSPPAANAQRYEDFTTKRPLPRGSYLVIGVLGGIESWNSPRRPVNVMAADLRARNFPSVFVETLEHLHSDLALRLIIDALDQNRDGKLDADERTSAHIILYGHSLGGATVVKLARKLQELEVPVQLTVQVDSIGSGDRDIPENVVHAANFYQRNGVFLRGLPEIRARNPQATSILGNFKYDYRHKKIDLSGVSPVERLAGGSHTKMEFDPDVWASVEGLILDEIK